MCGCDCELPDVTWESEPIARKVHYCCECNSMIEPGEKYYKIKGVWVGDFQTFNQCMTCRQVWQRALSENHFIGCLCYGELWEDVGHLYEKEI
jgi:hypothetical protein